LVPDVEHNGPLISVCIPTHHGRAGTLTVLVEALIQQADSLPGMIEVCISDNASQDGTAEIVAGLAARASCPVRYRRLPQDLGLVANLLSAVELAQGEYCWLMGSDDLPQEGALGRALERIQAMPGLTGYLVGAVYVDAEDPTKRSRQLPRAFHPAGGHPRQIDGLDAIYEQCGNSWIVLSWNIVERAAWNAALERQRDRVLANPAYPQVVILAEMARARAQWGWLAEPLVRQRNAPTFLFEAGDVPLADRWSNLIEGVAAVWADILGGRGGRRWRQRMRMVARVWGSAEDVRATKLYDRPPLSSQARFARAMFSAFWPVRHYWRDVVVATLTPVWLTRARHSAGAGRLARRVTFRPGQLILSGQLPSRLAESSVASIDVLVRNAGPRAVPVTGPDAVTIAQRWWTPDGVPLEWAMLQTNELAGMALPISHTVRRGRAVSTEIPIYAPVEPGCYRLEIVAHQPGRWLDEAGVATALSATVDVTGAGVDGRRRR
jgi:glycosyltransferase involved in cell wall biosynthesis